MSEKSYETEMLVITTIVGGLTLYGLYKIGQTASTAQQHAASAEQGIQNQVQQFQNQAQPILQNANQLTSDPFGTLWTDFKNFLFGTKSAPTAGTS